MSNCDFYALGKSIDEPNSTNQVIFFFVNLILEFILCPDGILYIMKIGFCMSTRESTSWNRFYVQLDRTTLSARRFQWSRCYLYQQHFYHSFFLSIAFFHLPLLTLWSLLWPRFFFSILTIFLKFINNQTWLYFFLYKRC